jgi:hypothetical protein
MNSIGPSELVKTSMAQDVSVRTNINSEGNMKTIEERRALPGSINLITLKTEILSALSSVSTATTTEEPQQADAAYRKALCAARSVGYRPHIRAANGQQIQVEWVALARVPFWKIPPILRDRVYDIQRG